MLRKMFLAADYLDIEGLTKVICKNVSDLIKDKSVDEVRRFFNVENDFNPEEMTEVMKDIEWASDK